MSESANTIVFTPYGRGSAVSLGNQRWRKMLLPVGKINYKGRVIKFTPDYLSELVRSFKEKAFDQVPFQLATEDNKHNNDPERFRGKVVSVEQDPKGVYAVVETTDEGAKLLATNPELGISARLYEGYERGDGKTWPVALQHVLGTLDPHIAGMGPWEKIAAVTLSNELSDEDVVDLTDVTFDVPKKKKESREEGKRPMGKKKGGLSAEERASLRESLDELTDEDLDLLGSEDATEDLIEDEDNLTDEELDELLTYAEAEYGDDEAEYDDDEEEGGDLALDTEGGDGEVRESRRTVATSRTGGDALEMANARIAEQGAELSRVTTLLDTREFASEKQHFTRQLGIPPKAVELARPLLEGTGHLVELSGGDHVDAGDIMRQVLTEIGEQIKILDLSGLIGNGEDSGDAEEEEERKAQEQETRDFVTTVRNNYNL